ncbi:MAG: hypothetical protein NTZ39_11240 [Methanoregula sp.]|nr:hypothetical protein [Methanoregula sp.]
MTSTTKAGSATPRGCMTIVWELLVNPIWVVTGMDAFGIVVVAIATVWGVVP